jgi:hypothetical protein
VAHAELPVIFVVCYEQSYTPLRHLTYLITDVSFRNNVYLTVNHYRIKCKSFYISLKVKTQHVSVHI